MKNASSVLKALVAVVLAASPTLAQSALEQLGRQAGEDAAPLARRLKDARAAGAAVSPAGVPRSFNDVFDICGVLGAEPAAPWNVRQAALLIQTCLNHSYTQDDATYFVEARAGRFSVPDCPDEDDGRPCRATAEVEGIRITVLGRLLTGNPVLGDLNYSLAKRGGKLLGFYALVDDQTRPLR